MLGGMITGYQQRTRGKSWEHQLDTRRKQESRKELYDKLKSVHRISITISKISHSLMVLGKALFPNHHPPNHVRFLGLRVAFGLLTIVTVLSLPLGMS